MANAQVHESGEPSFQLRASFGRQIALDELVSRHPLKLEFGCGSHKRDPSAIGIDLIPYDDVDIVGDAFDVMSALPNSSADTIYSAHFIEHLSDPSRFIRECERVLKVGGVLETIVPHWSNPYFYSDPTHWSFWGLYSMSYFAADALFRRKVPRYEKLSFKLTDARLVFRSAQEFPVDNFFRSLLSVPANSCRRAQELYERIFSHLVWCYEVRFTLVKIT